MENHTSLADALSSTAPAQSETQTETQVESKSQTETTEAPPQQTTEATAQVTEGETQPKPGPTRQERGLIRAIQESRGRVKELEAEIQALRAQSNPTQDFYEDPSAKLQKVATDTEAKVKSSLTFMSEQMARSQYKDFDDKLKAFEAELPNDPTLLSVITDSENPGEAVYRKGQEIQLRKKFGSSEESILAAAEKALRPKLEAEFVQRLKGKNNQPTNILERRAASGESAPDWRPSSIHEVFGTKR